MKKIKLFVQVKSKDTGEASFWSIHKVLDEINRDRSSGWTPYHEGDWEEGWREFGSHDYYEILEE